MGYGAIPIIAAVALVAHHVLFTDASARSKTVLVAIVAASLVIWRYHPRWSIAATLMQVGASIFMLVHLRMTE